MDEEDIFDFDNLLDFDLDFMDDFENIVDDDDPEKLDVDNIIYRPQPLQSNGSYTYQNDQSLSPIQPISSTNFDDDYVNSTSPLTPVTSNSPVFLDNNSTSNSHENSHLDMTSILNDMNDPDDNDLEFDDLSIKDLPKKIQQTLLRGIQLKKYGFNFDENQNVEHNDLYSNESFIDIDVENRKKLESNNNVIKQQQRNNNGRNWNRLPLKRPRERVREFNQPFDQLFQSLGSYDSIDDDSFLNDNDMHYDNDMLQYSYQNNGNGGMNLNIYEGYNNINDDNIRAHKKRKIHNNLKCENKIIKNSNQNISQRVTYGIDLNAKMNIQSNSFMGNEGNILRSTDIQMERIEVSANGSKRFIYVTSDKYNLYVRKNKLVKLSLVYTSPKIQNPSKLIEIREGSPGNYNNHLNIVFVELTSIEKRDDNKWSQLCTFEDVTKYIVPSKKGHVALEKKKKRKKQKNDNNVEVSTENEFKIIIKMKLNEKKVAEGSVLLKVSYRIVLNRRFWNMYYIFVIDSGKHNTKKISLKKVVTRVIREKLLGMKFTGLNEEGLPQKEISENIFEYEICDEKSTLKVNPFQHSYSYFTPLSLPIGTHTLCCSEGKGDQKDQNNSNQNSQQSNPNANQNEDDESEDEDYDDDESDESDESDEDDGNVMSLKEVNVKKEKKVPLFKADASSFWKSFGIPDCQKTRKTVSLMTMYSKKKQVVFVLGNGYRKGRPNCIFSRPNVKLIQKVRNFKMSENQMNIACDIVSLFKNCRIVFFDMNNGCSTLTIVEILNAFKFLNSFSKSYQKKANVVCLCTWNYELDMRCDELNKTLLSLPTNCVVLSALGNNNLDVSSKNTFIYPYKIGQSIKGIVGIGATENNKKIADFSNYCKSKLQSTILFANARSTSYATLYSSMFFSIIWGLFPWKSNEQMIQMIQKGACNELKDKEITVHIMNNPGKLIYDRIGNIVAENRSLKEVTDVLSNHLVDGEDMECVNSSNNQLFFLHNAHVKNEIDEKLFEMKNIQMELQKSNKKELHNNAVKLMSEIKTLKIKQLFDVYGNESTPLLIDYEAVIEAKKKKHEKELKKISQENKNEKSDGKKKPPKSCAEWASRVRESIRHQNFKATVLLILKMFLTKSFRSLMEKNLNFDELWMMCLNIIQKQVDILKIDALMIHNEDVIKVLIETKDSTDFQLFSAVLKIVLPKFKLHILLPKEEQTCAKSMISFFIGVLKLHCQLLSNQRNQTLFSIHDIVGHFDRAMDKIPNKGINVNVKGPISTLTTIFSFPLVYKAIALELIGNDYNEALKIYSKAIEKNPFNSFAYYSKANLLFFKLHKYKDAELAYNKVLMNKKDFLPALLNLSVLRSTMSSKHDKQRNFKSVSKSLKFIVDKMKKKKVIVGGAFYDKIIKSCRLCMAIVNYKLSNHMEALEIVQSLLQNIGIRESTIKKKKKKKRRISFKGLFSKKVEILKVDPYCKEMFQNRSALLNLQGLLYYELNNNEKAIESLKESIKYSIEANSYIPLNNLGLIYSRLEGNKIPESINAFKESLEVLEEYGNKRKINASILSEIYTNKGMALLRGSPRNNNELNIDNEKEEINIRRTKASSKASSKIVNEAIYNFKKALSINNNNYLAYKSLGIIELKLRNSAQAFIYLNEAIKSNPNDIYLYLLRGISLIFIDGKNAKIDLDHFIRYKPDNELGYYYRALSTLFPAFNEFKIVFKDLNKSVELNDKFAKGYSALGVLLMKVKSPLKALNMFNKSIKANNTLVSSFFNRASLNHVFLMDYESAEKDYDRCIELDGMNELYYGKKAGLYKMMGRKDLEKKNMDVFWKIRNEKRKMFEERKKMGMSKLKRKSKVFMF